MNIKLGPALKICASINTLREWCRGTGGSFYYCLVLTGINTWTCSSFSKKSSMVSVGMFFAIQCCTINHVEAWRCTVYFLDIECAKACMYTFMCERWAWTAWSICASSVCQFFLSLWVEALCMFTQMKLQICQPAVITARSVSQVSSPVGFNKQRHMPSFCISNGALTLVIFGLEWCQQRSPSFKYFSLLVILL